MALPVSQTVSQSVSKSGRRAAGKWFRQKGTAFGYCRPLKMMLPRILDPREMKFPVSHPPPHEFCLFNLQFVINQTSSTEKGLPAIQGQQAGRAGPSYNRRYPGNVVPKPTLTTNNWARRRIIEKDFVCGCRTLSRTTTTRG